MEGVSCKEVRSWARSVEKELAKTKAEEVPEPAIEPPPPVIVPVTNSFVNDGSFMEAYRKRLELAQKVKEEKECPEAGESGKKKVTGRAKPYAKVITQTTRKKGPKEKVVRNDAWAAYMQEVESYKTNSCKDEDVFSRPLCK